MSELAIVMPVYNEEGAITKVLDDWSAELQRLGIDGKIHVYNDGSKDRTFEILKQYAVKNPIVVPHDKLNSGHGSTILKGYRENTSVDWIFQIDSDDELGPEKFEELWNNRNQYDFLICKRENRFSPWSRRLITFVARMTVKVFYGSGVYDVNSPYRLMRSSVFKDVFFKIPEHTFAPNLVISGYACYKKVRIYQSSISHRDRTTGVVSIKKWKLAKAAFKSLTQTVLTRYKIFGV